MNRVRGRIRVLEVYVVGSRARGDYRDDSDIDLVIISNDVEGLNQLRRRELLIDLLEPGFEFFIYTEREWNEPPMTWIRQLRREARRLEDLLIEYGIY
jgi:hypothetical protein